MSVLALSVLGLMGLAFMVDIGGSDSDDDSLDEGGPDDGDSLEEAPVAEAPVEGLQFVDQAIVAAEGGATLPDDVFESFTSANIAGEGADTLTGSDESMELIVGNGGDDVLTGGLGDVLVGGEGDDTLNYDTGDSSGDFGYSGVSGDAGDDTLNLRHELGWSNFYDTAITSATGGEGADDFRIELVDGINVDSEFEGYSDITSGDTAQIYVRDFVPDEDFLTVDISSFTASGNYQLTDVTLSEGAPLLPYEEADGWHELKLSLLADGQTEPFEAIVPFRSVGGEVTLDDITLITGLAT